MATDKDGNILCIAQDCDSAMINTEWALCMGRHGYKRNLDPSADSKPVRPTDVFNRRAIGYEQEGDERSINYFNKSNDQRDKDCSVVAPIYVRMMTQEIYQELSLLVTQKLSVNTKE